jgi:ABC-2 type transport system permease protein
MSKGSFWLPVWALWRRELVRFWREKARVVGFVGSPLLFWLVIGSGFGDLGFFFPGALVLTVMFSAVFSTMSLIEDRREGFLLSMLVSPAPRGAMVLGKVLGSSTLAFIQGVIFLALAPLAGLLPPFSGFGKAALVVFLVSFAFTSMGFLLAWVLDSSQGFHAVMNLILFPLWMISGAIFTAEKAHGWMRLVMELNPLTYSMNALREFLETGAAFSAPGMELNMTITVLFGLVLFAAAIYFASKPGARAES